MSAEPIIQLIRLAKAEALRDAATELRKDQSGLGPFSGGIAYSVSRLKEMATSMEPLADDTYTALQCDECDDE